MELKNNNILRDVVIFSNEKEYLTRWVSIVEAIYFTDKKLTKLEKEFFVVCLMGIRRNFGNIHKGKFFELLSENYFKGREVKVKSQHICVMRAKLVAKGYLAYDEDNLRMSVSEAWNIFSDEMSLEVNLKLTSNE